MVAGATTNTEIGEVHGCNFVRATRLVRLAVAMWSCLLGTAAQPAALSSLPATERILMVVLSIEAAGVEGSGMAGGLIGSAGRGHVERSFCPLWLRHNGRKRDDLKWVEYRRHKRHCFMFNHLRDPARGNGALYRAKHRKKRYDSVTNDGRCSKRVKPSLQRQRRNAGRYCKRPGVRLAAPWCSVVDWALQMAGLSKQLVVLG